MALSVLNFFVACALSILFSNVQSAFGDWTVCFHFFVIASLYECLKGEFHISIIFVILMGMIGDSMASGPPGVYFFMLVLMYFMFYLSARRMKGGRFIIVMLIGVFLGSMVFDIGYGLILSLVYPESSISSMIASVSLRDGLSNLFICLPVLFVLGIFEKVLEARRDRARRRL